MQNHTALYPSTVHLRDNYGNFLPGLMYMSTVQTEMRIMLPVYHIHSFRLHKYGYNF